MNAKNANETGSVLLLSLLFAFICVIRGLIASCFHHPGQCRIGAHDRNRTCDLFLTKEVLYRLSYVSEISAGIPAGKAKPPSMADFSQIPQPSSMTAKTTPGIHAGLVTKARAWRVSAANLLWQAIQWSGRRESNPHHQLGRLRFYH
jgi:hypothetical protein